MALSIGIGIGIGFVNMINSIPANAWVDENGLPWLNQFGGYWLTS